MKKFLVLIVFLVCLALLGWQISERIADSSKSRGRQRRAAPVPVEVVPVQERVARDMGLFTGTLYPHSQFIVAPKIAGRLEKLYVQIGDALEENQLIAVLEDDEYLQQVDQAKAELEVASANLEQSRSDLPIATREYERVKALRKKKIISESELDLAEANYKAQSAKNKVSLAQVSQKKAALKAAQVRLSYTQIRATWDDGGEIRYVGERFVDEGAMLAPNASIVSIIDIQNLIAVIYVIERDYAKVRIGQEAVITTDAFDGRVFRGKVVRVAPLLKVASREARVEMEVPNPEGLLKPGMFIRAEMEFDKKENALVIPVQAITKRNGKSGVFLVDTQEMKAHFVPVIFGITSKEWAEVVDPPLSGPVVTLGQHLLQEGSTVILPGEKREPRSRGVPGDKTNRKKRGREG
jgi:RND family efflux transporter MFP subunit